MAAVAAGPAPPDGWRPRQPGGDSGFSQWRLPPQRGETGPARGSGATERGDWPGCRVTWAGRPARRRGPGPAARPREALARGARIGWVTREAARRPCWALAAAILRSGAGPCHAWSRSRISSGETSTRLPSHTHTLGPWRSGRCRKRSPRCAGTKICPHAELEVRQCLAGSEPDVASLQLHSPRPEGYRPVAQRGLLLCCANQVGLQNKMLT